MDYTLSSSFYDFETSFINSYVYDNELKIPDNFTQTSIFRMVEATVAHCLTTSYPAFIIGGSGLGKTTALHYLAANDQQKASYMVIECIRHSHKKLLLAIWEAFGWNANGFSVHDLEDYLEERLPYLARNGSYLIIDEAQNLSLKQINWFVDLADKFRFPIIFSGNQDALKVKNPNDATYMRITDRIGKFCKLEKALENDFILIAKEYGVAETPENTATIVNYGKIKGIRKLVRFLESARSLSDNNGQIEQVHLKDAIEFLS